jgi:hypothetical protein
MGTTASRAGLASWLFLALLLALVAVLAWMPVYPDCDFWGHAAAGRWAVESRQVPRRGLFVWTAPDHPWTDHMWLSQVLFFGLARLGGDDEGAARAALVFTAVMACVPFALAWLLWRRRARPGLLAVLPFYLAIDVSRGRFLPRPELFTAAGVAVLLLLLAGWRGEASRRRTALTGVALVVLFGAWANLHGAFVVGVLLLLAAAACDGWQYRDRRSGLLAALAAAAVLATFLNPYGPGVYRALLLVRSRTFEGIEEWKPLWRVAPVPWAGLAEHAALLAVALLAWGLNPSRRLAGLAWLLLAAGLFARAQRNGGLSALVCLMVTADNAASLDAAAAWRALSARLSGGKPRPLPALPGVLLGCAAAAWLGLQLWSRWLDAEQLARPLSPQALDNGAVRFMKGHQVRGPGLCDYETSSYLQWRLAGDPPLFIDLMNAYPDVVSNDYDHIAVVTPRGQELLARGDIVWVLLTAQRPVGAPSLAPLAAYLDASPGWMRAYCDSDGVLWVRRTPENEARLGGAYQDDFRRLELLAPVRFPLP